MASESYIDRIEQSDGKESSVYEYHGPGSSGDIVSRVKSHHADVSGTNYNRLTARKIADGGRREKVTTVVVVGPPYSEGEGESAECRRCETELTGDDLTYRVLYGRYHHAAAGNVSEKQMARPGEELDPGVDERYYCFDCYKEYYKREAAAHFEYETADELWSILEAADGRLVADARPMTVGGRRWVRVVDGDAQERHSVRYRGGSDDDWDIGFDTEPTEDFDREDFDEFFGGLQHSLALVLLKPVDETPFVAGMNQTLRNRRTFRGGEAGGD